MVAGGELLLLSSLWLSAAVVMVVVLRSAELPRRKALNRWRMTGIEAATMVRAGSMKPQRTRGRELSVG